MKLVAVVVLSEACCCCCGPVGLRFSAWTVVVAGCDWEKSHSGVVVTGAVGAFVAVGDLGATNCRSWSTLS